MQFFTSKREACSIGNKHAGWFPFMADQSTCERDTNIPTIYTEQLIYWACQSNWINARCCVSALGHANNRCGIRLRPERVALNICEWKYLLLLLSDCNHGDYWGNCSRAARNQHNWVVFSLLEFEFEIDSDNSSLLRNTITRPKFTGCCWSWNVSSKHVDATWSWINSLSSTRNSSKNNNKQISLTPHSLMKSSIQLNGNQEKYY